ncbi:hypothetical protein AAG747_20190 [Rapidithrix thailandica]|uniref:Uncharacterized protein n=1 Tax=Rapidithrix thailandica TaxID=413964 RepID=A0AAW9SEN1_9BACT
MKYTLSLLLLFAVSTTIQAQSRADRIHQIKVKFIKETLALSQEDSIQFFPIYEEFEKEKRMNQRKIHKLKVGVLAKSDAQLKSDIETMFQLKEEEVEINRKYFDKFLKVISVRQVAALYFAERQFRKKLLNKIGQE